jgi:hypothetical protein
MNSGLNLLVSASGIEVSNLTLPPVRMESTAVITLVNTNLLGRANQKTLFNTLGGGK